VCAESVEGFTRSPNGVVKPGTWPHGVPAGSVVTFEPPPPETLVAFFRAYTEERHSANLPFPKGGHRSEGKRHSAGAFPDAVPTKYTVDQVKTAINKAVEAKGLARPCVGAEFKSLYRDSVGLTIGQNHPYAARSLVGMLTEIFDQLDTACYAHLQTAVMFMLSLKLGMRDRESDGWTGTSLWRCALENVGCTSRCKRDCRIQGSGKA